MKKVLFILIPLLLLGYLLLITLIPRTNFHKQDVKSEILFTENPENKVKDVPFDHDKKSSDCKSCHDCEYPTKQDPCLKACPREKIDVINRTADEGPDIVTIGEMSDNYSAVVFSHKVHAQMSEISTGCVGCHHYNTTGPILNCRKCHESVRTREDVSIPDLKAAYHRQCTGCHKQWSLENGCNNQCHLTKGSDNKNISDEQIKLISGKTHPKSPEPTKMVFETNSDKGKIVTFFHDEHVKLFKIKCNDCHKQDNCTKCHDKDMKKDFSKPVKIKKSFEEHHKPCSSCHDNNACGKCHKENEMTSFNHGKSTGWVLQSYHSNLECTRCHGTTMPYKKLNNNCSSCHKFTKDNFDHKYIGFTLSEAHKDMDCETCHLKGNFSSAPVCKECHDDKSFPKDLPGKKGKK